VWGCRNSVYDSVPEGLFGGVPVVDGEKLTGWNGNFIG